MIFRLRDYIPYLFEIKRFHDMLGESQFWPSEKRRAWIQEHLEKTLRHAVKNVPYYKRTLSPYESRFNDIIDRLDLTELPFITKETVRNHFDEMHAVDSRRNGTTTVRTSGTTGTPTEFLVDRQSHICQFASLWRVLNWTGYRFGDRFVDIRRNPKKARTIRYDVRQNSLVLSVFHLKKENVPFYIQKIEKFNPVLIKTYPSAVDLLCRWLKELDIDTFQPNTVITCAESLLEHQRSNIEETLKCPLFDFYNHNERAGLISTCEKGRYHIHEEYSFVEIMNGDRMPADPKSTGEIVTTSFHNFSMPLIRYRTGDIASVDENSVCECGRTYKTVSKISGRVTDIIITPDGRHLAGLEHAFMDSPGILSSQIVQETVDEIQVNIVKADSYTQRDVENIEKELNLFLDESMNINFNFVDSILPGNNGKFQFVVSKPGKEALQQA